MRLIQLLFTRPVNVSEGPRGEVPSAATEQSGRPSRRTTGLFDSRGPRRTESSPEDPSSVTGLGRGRTIEARRGNWGENVSALYPRKCPSSRLIPRRESRLDWTSQNRKGEPSGVGQRRVSYYTTRIQLLGRQCSKICQPVGQPDFSHVPTDTRMLVSRGCGDVSRGARRAGD